MFGGLSVGIVAVLLVCGAVAVLVGVSLHLTGRREISDVSDTPDEVDVPRSPDTPSA